MVNTLWEAASSGIYSGDLRWNIICGQPIGECQDAERLVALQHPEIAHIRAQFLSRQDNLHGV